MRPSILAFALVGASLAAPLPALADNPLDPEMQTAEARALDRALIRQLNLDMLAIVRERDARQALGWREYELFESGQHPDQLAYKASFASYQAQMAEYEASRARSLDDQRQYQLAMDAWRRDVAACRAGNRESCGGN